LTNYRACDLIGGFGFHDIKNEALVSRITSKCSNQDSGSNKKAAEKVKVKDISQISKASVGA
jgi:hypothetical protein